MLGKLIKLVTVVGIAKKAYDGYQEKKAERAALDRMAADIQPKATAKAKAGPGARKGGARKTALRRVRPAAD